MDNKTLRTLCNQKSLSKANLKKLTTIFSQGEVTNDNVNSTDEKGNTLLLAAIEHGHEDLAMMLMDEQQIDPELGLDVNARNSAGRTPLMLCISEGLGQLVSRLVELGCDPNLESNTGETALTMASADSSLLDDLANIDGINTETRTGDFSRTPLQHAVLADSDSSVVKLVEMKADVNVRDSDGNTALHLAVLNSSSNIGTFLVQQGADLSIQNHNGDTALHLAERLSQKKMSEILLAGGADSSIKNNEGLSAIDMAQLTISETEAELDAQAKELAQLQEYKEAKVSDDIFNFLQQHGLEQHTDFFVSRKYKLNAVLNMTEKRLNEIAFPAEDIPKLTAALIVEEDSSDEEEAKEGQTRKQKSHKVHVDDSKVHVEVKRERMQGSYGAKKFIKP